MIAITRDQFHRYVRLQRSGRTNMADRPVVAALIFVSEEKVKDIQMGYELLQKKFGMPKEPSGG